MGNAKYNPGTRSRSLIPEYQRRNVHYGENPNYDILNDNGLETIIEYENPDFVVFSGDMISAYNPVFFDITHYRKTWVRLTEPLRKRNIPWAIIFGNHDGEGPLTNYEISSIDMEYELSYTQHGPMDISGESNYLIEILSSSESDPWNVASLIYMFDSDTPGCHGNGSWGCIQRDQVQWYRDQSNIYNTEAVAFVHIPPIEVVDLWNHHTVWGEFGDSGSCCYYTEHSEFVDTMVRQKDVKGLFFGHDHRNDFHGIYKGIDLGYGRKSGFGSYDPKNIEGARVIELTESPFQLRTWIRTIRGDIDVQQVHQPEAQDAVPRVCASNTEMKDAQMWVIYVVFCASLLLASALVQLKISFSSNQNRNNAIKIPIILNHSSNNNNSENNNNNNSNFFLNNNNNKKKTVISL
eukprot:gene5813-7231_t